MTMRLYKSYVFRTKDPVIDELRTIFQDEFGSKFGTNAFKTVELNGGPSETAMRGWFYGTVRRPQNASIEAAGRALGKRRIWVDHKIERVVRKATAKKNSKRSAAEPKKE